MGLLTWFKGQMFGGKIIRSVGSVATKAPGLMSAELRVHILEGKSPAQRRLIGIEFVAKSALSYQMMPCTLTVDSCRELSELLQRAIQQ